MKLFDLEKLLDGQYYIETVQNKLNNTFVKHNGEFVYCRAFYEEEGWDHDNDCPLNGDFNINIIGLTNKYSMYVEELKNLEIDFIWPDPGFYDSQFEEEYHYLSLSYINHYSWKVGIPEHTLHIDSTVSYLNTRKKVVLLNNLKEPNRSMEEAVALTGAVKKVPVNSDVGLIREAGIIYAMANGFDQHTGGVRLGKVEDEVIKLEEYSTAYDELLDHHGLKYDHLI